MVEGVVRADTRSTRAELGVDGDGGDAFGSAKGIEVADDTKAHGDPCLVGGRAATRLVIDSGEVD